VRFEVFTTKKLHIGVFWFMTSCSLSLEEHAAVFFFLPWKWQDQVFVNVCNHLTDYMLLEFRRSQYEFEISDWSLQLNMNFCNSDHLISFHT